MRSNCTVVDVARRAGVCPGTVSRVMNNRADVAAEIRERVLRASRELGFAPKTRRRTVGIVAGIADISDASNFTSSMVALLTRDLALAGFSPAFVGGSDLGTLKSLHVDGVIDLTFGETILALRGVPNLPLVSINNPMMEQGVHSIATDHRQQGLLAAAHLLERGHRRIAFIEKSELNWGSRERLAGYKDALRNAGMAFEPELIRHTSQQPLYEIISTVLKKGATAIANFCDPCCLEAIHIIKNILHLDIPGDVSLVTLENLPVYQYFSPPQTVVRQSTALLAKTVAEKVVALIEAKPAAAAPAAGKGKRKGRPPSTLDILLPCDLVERESVATLLRR